MVATYNFGSVYTIEIQINLSKVSNLYTKVRQIYSYYSILFKLVKGGGGA